MTTTMEPCKIQSMYVAVLLVQNEPMIRLLDLGDRLQIEARTVGTIPEHEEWASHDVDANCRYPRTPGGLKSAIEDFVEGVDAVTCCMLSFDNL